VLALQQVIPLVAQVAGTGQPLLIEKVSVLPDGHGQGGDGFARATIGVTEQLRSALGIDLPALAQRFQEPARPVIQAAPAVAAPAAAKPAPPAAKPPAGAAPKPAAPKPQAPPSDKKPPSAQ